MDTALARRRRPGRRYQQHERRPADTRSETLERFDEAARLLTAARDRLDAATAEQHQQAASRSIDEARAHIADTATRLDAATAAVLEALPAFREALSTAETFLDATDVPRLASELAEIRRMVETAASDQSRAVEAERDEARNAHQALLDKVTALPERVRRKHSLL